jgi:hypothetical protein
MAVELLMAVTLLGTLVPLTLLTLVLLTQWNENEGKAAAAAA